jgi:hypothetical protein
MSMRVGSQGGVKQIFVSMWGIGVSKDAIFYVDFKNINLR